MVKGMKRADTSDGDFSIQTLHEYFNDKFRNDGQCDSGVYLEAVCNVEDIYIYIYIYI